MQHINNEDKKNVGIMILGKFLLPIYILEKMREKIEESFRENREHAFNLYVDKDNIIYSEDDTEGTESGVELKDPNFDKGFIGSFHTHPNRYIGLSPCDMSICFENKNQLTFIGTYDGVSYFKLKNKYIHIENYEKIKIKLKEMDIMDNQLSSRLKNLINKKSCTKEKIEEEKIESEINIVNKEIKRLREEKNKVENTYFNEHIIGRFDRSCKNDL